MALIGNFVKLIELIELIAGQLIAGQFWVNSIAPQRARGLKNDGRAVNPVRRGADTGADKNCAGEEVRALWAKYDL